VSTSASVWVPTAAHSHQSAGVDQIHILAQGRLQEEGSRAFVGKEAFDHESATVRAGMQLEVQEPRYCVISSGKRLTTMENQPQPLPSYLLPLLNFSHSAFLGSIPKLYSPLIPAARESRSSTCCCTCGSSWRRAQFPASRAEVLLESTLVPPHDDTCADFHFLSLKSGSPTHQEAGAVCRLGRRRVSISCLLRAEVPQRAVAAIAERLRRATFQFPAS
jgi:hypothetical protein